MSVRCLVLLFLLNIIHLQLSAQADTTGQNNAATSTNYGAYYADSASRQRWILKRDSIRRVQDSLKTLGDSLSALWIKRPDPGRPNQFMDSLVDHYTVKNLDFAAWGRKFPKTSSYEAGRLRPKGEIWIFGFVIFLLLFFAILRNAFIYELSAMVHAFFSNRVLGQINKEENFFNSWPFVFLYLLFGFTIGMFLFQCGRYFRLSYGYSGINWFLRLSLIVIGLYTFKIAIVRLLGFLFDAGKMVKEYIAILYLSYFNAALIFLPLVIAFSLTPGRYASYYINLSLILIAAIYFFQFLRAMRNILSGYKFPKVYLIIYLCALEICPLLILIKALRF